MHRREFLSLAASTGAAFTLPHRLRSSAPRPVSVDVHAHWEPEPYYQAITRLRPYVGTRDPRDFDLAKRMAWMDAHGVRTHVLTLDGGMPWQWVEPEAGDQLARAINDAAVEAHKAYPDRFIGVVEMSLRSPELALRELNRMAGQPGIRAAHLPNSIEGRDYLFQPEYAPLLADCEALGFPLLFHPLDGAANIYGGAGRVGDSLSVRANLNNTLGFPFDTATLASKFITTGALDRYPKLDIVLPHAGGAFPYVAGRLQHGFERRKFPLQRTMPEYVRRFHYDSLTYYPGTLKFLVDLVGADRVLIGTDNFAPMDVDFPNTPVENLKVSSEDKQRILHGNAARLFRLDS